MLCFTLHRRVNIVDILKAMISPDIEASMVTSSVRENIQQAGKDTDVTKTVMCNGK